VAEQWVVIDGSQGEGGGQIVRTSLALACVTGRAVRIERVRAGRPRPGLAAQHVSSVRAAREICGGWCEGAAKGSSKVAFRPGKVSGGPYDFAIGTAGACSLVVQTVLPALFLAERPSRVKVTGGTHNPLAPPFDFLERTFLAWLGECGWRARARLVQPGFYPAGGGKLAVDVEPTEMASLRPVEWVGPRGQTSGLRCTIYTAHLPGEIADKQERLLRRSGLPIERIEQVAVADSAGPGNCMVAEVRFACGGERATVFSAFGQKGKPSEQVIRELAEQVRAFLESRAVVEKHLADQLLLYVALAGGGRFTTDEVSHHCRTNMEVVQAFLPVEFGVRDVGWGWEISCVPR